MRRTLTTACLVGALLVPAPAAFAANTARPGGSITNPEDPMPGNGGDQGWGNCGHNSSVGNPHTGDAGSVTGRGNGGDNKAQCLTPPEG